MSHINFNVGLESIFRDADQVNSALAITDDIHVKGETVDKTGFADDDVTMWSREGAGRLSTTVQNIQYFSERAGLRINASKSYAQHIGHDSDAPGVTCEDIKALKMPICCPVSWCSRRFSTRRELRGHELWHRKQAGSIMDQQELAKGSILCARGPPDHRFFLVEWTGPTRTQWLHQRNFLADCLPMIELYFQVNHHLDRNSNLEVSWEYRCSQCNAFLQSEDALESHIQQQL